MDLPNLNMEIYNNMDKNEANFILESFLKGFINQQRNEISKLEASCEKLEKSKEDLQASKYQHLRDIFVLTHATMNDSDKLHKLSQQMKIKQNIYRIGSQRVDEMVMNFKSDYLNWRGTMEEQIKSSRAGEDLLELTQSEIEDKIETMKKEIEIARNELSAIETSSSIENAQFKDNIQAMQSEINMLNTLKSEMSVYQERLIDELREYKSKSLQETNKLSLWIAALKRKLELYE